jgi:hypothetical protein
LQNNVTWLEIGFFPIIICIIIILLPIINLSSDVFNYLFRVIKPFNNGNND